MSELLTDEMLSWGLSKHYRGDGLPLCYHCDDVDALLRSKDAQIATMEEYKRKYADILKRCRESSGPCWCGVHQTEITD